MTRRSLFGAFAATPAMTVKKTAPECPFLWSGWRVGLECDRITGWWVYPLPDGRMRVSIVGGADWTDRTPKWRVFTSHRGEAYWTECALTYADAYERGVRDISNGEDLERALADYKQSAFNALMEDLKKGNV